MRIFKTKEFAKFANKEGLTDKQLYQAVAEIEDGLVDADLGSGLYKKRVANNGQGKSGALRTLLAYREGKKTFFIYGFPKTKGITCAQMKSGLKEICQGASQVFQ